MALTESEAREVILSALRVAQVDHDTNNQGRRIKRLAGMPETTRVFVVRGGYRGTKRARTVLGYTNHRAHGHRVYTLVAEA